MPQQNPSGTTSACAENTACFLVMRAPTRNYLRVRGEYAHHHDLNPEHWELPPRARRIPATENNLINFLGTTSACAENTDLSRLRGFAQWNYLRVRGEYCMAQGKPFPPVELPPRARRIPSNSASLTESRGTTSACAENTSTTPRVGRLGGNYLRVRGEYPK